MKQLILVMAAFALATKAAYAGQAFIAPYFGAVIPIDSSLSENDDGLELELGSGAAIGMRTGYYFGDDGIIGAFVDANAQFPQISELGMGDLSNDGDAMVFSLSLNAVVRPVTGPVRPYFGAGLGISAMKLDADNVEFRSWDYWGNPTYDSFNISGVTAGPSWNVFGGVEYLASDHCSIFAEFRYQQAYLEPSGYDLEYKTGLAVIGVAYRW